MSSISTISLQPSLFTIAYIPRSKFRMEVQTNSAFVKNIQELLRNGNAVGTLDLFRDVEKCTDLKNDLWDLIPVVTEFLTSQCEKDNGEVFKCCEQLINIIAVQSNPEEVLLQLIEELEECEDDVKFSVLLNPLGKTLLRIPPKRLISFAWGFNAIQSFLSKCKTPDSRQLVGKEKLLLDNDERTLKISALCKKVLLFYERLLDEIHTTCEVDGGLMEVVRKYLIRLLGRPLVYLDMEVFDGIKGRGRLLGERLIARIFQTTCDPISLLELRFSPETIKLFQLNTLGTAALFYLVYSENIFVERVPKVYSTIHFFQNSLHLVTTLLVEDEQIVVEKGLKLAFTLLQHVKFSKLPYSVLDSEDHCKFCQSLAKVIVYNEVDHVRKSALNVYKTYLGAFDIHGSYLLVYNLMSVLNHSGLIGFTITQYKELIAQEFLRNENNFSVYLKGQKLRSLLGKFCRLHKREQSDLIEFFDQIMASLNLLLYLSLRDKHNTTGIWDYYDELDKNYFKQLRKGIEISRAHYQLKIKDVKEEARNKEKNKEEVSVIVSGQNLSAMSAPEKLEVLKSSLTAFDMIDSLLSNSSLKIFSVCRLNSTDSSTSQQENGKSYDDDIKNKILAASLPFVPELGWSKDAISKGAQCAGYPGVSHGMFSRGGAELLHFFQTSSNSKLVETLKKLQDENKEHPILPGHFAEKAIQARLKMMAPYIKKWPQAIAIMSLPPNVPNSLATLLTMVDDICYYAGDRSVDFNWYLRRLGIAGVYKATELYMMQDKSEEFQATWTFLNRRLVEAVQLHDLLSKSEVTSQAAKDTAQSVFITARNILGLNWNR
ncbi:hypothetical protein JTB14_005453 [Gonioctena quinquepunctata]|nr:hypothetical protein JTB14_005453 [Gonioctena quinquepunctata]